MTSSLDSSCTDTPYYLCRNPPNLSTCSVPVVLFRQLYSVPCSSVTFLSVIRKPFDSSSVNNGTIAAHPLDSSTFVISDPLLRRVRLCQLRVGLSNFSRVGRTVLQLSVDLPARKTWSAFDPSSGLSWARSRATVAASPRESAPLHERKLGLFGGTEVGIDDGNRRRWENSAICDSSMARAVGGLLNRMRHRPTRTPHRRFFYRVSSIPPHSTSTPYLAKGSV